MSLPQGRTLDDFIRECEEAATFENEYKAHFKKLSPLEKDIMKRLIIEKDPNSVTNYYLRNDNPIHYQKPSL